ncbi:MAG: FUSC family protein [Nitrospirota bacterium]
MLSIIKRLDTTNIRHSLKTALAAAMSMLFCDLLELKQGYWSVISVIIVMQSHSGGSIGAAWSRVLGTLFGAVMGVVLLTIMGSNLLTMGISIFLSVFISFYLSKYHDSFRVTAITASIIIMIGGTNPLTTGISRLLEITVGILIALFVSLFLWPSKASDALARGISSMFEKSSELFQTLVQCLMTAEYDDTKISNLRREITATIQNNSTLFTHYLREPGRFTTNTMDYSTIMDAQRRIFEILTSMSHSVKGAECNGFQQEFAVEINALENVIVDALNAKTFPNLSEAVNAMESRRLELRKTNTALNYSVDDVAHFISFSYSLKELAFELEGIRTAVLSTAL